MSTDDPEEYALRRQKLLAAALAEKLQRPDLDAADRAILEGELERATEGAWDARQRLFDRDPTGQDEEAFYERYSLSGESYPRNDAGEYLGLM
jgi:hypothetical protein